MNKDLLEISDGKLYGNNDMAKISCHDCQGCSSCCQDMGESIWLDPYDVYQLTRNLTIDEIKKSGFDTYFVDHTAGIYPVAASGMPFTATYLQSKGDVITDLHEDLAAEQKARTTYDNILRLVDDPDVREPIKFLRQRELVHYQRFGEGLQLVTDKLNSKNFYAFNPGFDKHCNKNMNNKRM